MNIVRSKVVILFVILLLLGITLMVLGLYPFANTISGTILLNLGVTFLTSGTVSLLFEISARKETGNELIMKVASILSPLPQNIVLANNRNNIQFQGIITTAGKQLDLMGLTLPDITEQGLLPLYLDAIENNGTCFRILLLNPNSSTAKIRAEYPLYNLAESIFEVSRSSILRLHRFSSQLKAKGIDESRFDVRLYNELPLCITITDHSLILSVYIVDVIGQHAPYIEFKGDAYSSKFCISLREHFEKVWSTSQSIASMSNIDVNKLVDCIPNK
jgi:hypothetical protein